MRSLFCTLLFLVCCTPQHAVISTPPSYDSSVDCKRACGVMAEAGCPVGNDPNCVNALSDDQAQGVASQIDLACILDAGANRDALARCNVTCQ